MSPGGPGSLSGVCGGGERQPVQHHGRQVPRPTGCTVLYCAIYRLYAVCCFVSLLHVHIGGDVSGYSRGITSWYFTVFLLCREGIGHIPPLGQWMASSGGSGGGSGGTASIAGLVVMQHVKDVAALLALQGGGARALGGGTHVYTTPLYRYTAT